MLKVFLAGRVLVETDGVVIDERAFPGRQGRLLFAYLACEDGRAVPRGEFAEVLWEVESFYRSLCANARARHSQAAKVS